MGHGRGKGAFSGYSCIKYMFFFFNVIFWLLGCALLGVGIWLHVSQGPYATLAPSYSWLSLTSICMVAGSVVILLGFFGCCGAIMENQCMLILYFVLVVGIFILEVAGIVLAFVYHQNIDKFLKKELQTGIKDKSAEKGLNAAWDAVQHDLRCCGSVNYTDWYDAERWSEQGDKKQVPQSCCVEENCPTTTTGNITGHWHSEGCYKQVQETLDKHIVVVVAVAVVVGILQVLGLVASMVLFCYLRSEKYDEYMPSDQY